MVVHINSRCHFYVTSLVIHVVQSSNKDTPGIINDKTCHGSVLCYPLDGMRRLTKMIRNDLATWWRHQRKKISRYWSFVRGIHRSSVNSPHKGQWRGALMFALIYTWTNGYVNNRDPGDLRRHRAHYDGTVMEYIYTCYSRLESYIIFVTKSKV